MKNKKNVIVVVADAMSDYFIDKKIGDEYVCPFMHELAGNSIRAKKMYSQAPYTMAALQGLLSGVKTLDIEDYSVVINNDNDLIFDIFAKEGYQIYTTEYGSFIPPRRTTSMGNHFLMEISGSLKFLEPFIVNYIEKIRKCCDKREYYYHRLEDCVAKAFEGAAITFSDNCTDLSNIKFFEEIVRPNSIQKNIFDREYTKFATNKIKYIDELIEQGKRHSFFEIDDLLNVQLENQEDLERFFDEHKKEFKKVRARGYLLNVLNEELPVQDLFKSVFNKLAGKKVNSFNVVNFLQRLILGAYNITEYKKNNYRMHGIASAWTLLDTLEEMIKGGKTKAPFFVYAHLSDTHQPFNFFTGEDISLAEGEMQNIFNLVNKIKQKDYKGSISYLMSARYVDICMERFVKKAKEDGLLENTILVFTADHGLLYGDSPLRNNNQGDNFNYESFHVPFIMIDYHDYESRQIEEVVSSLDFLPTISNRAGLSENREFIGYDIMSDNHRGYACIEWMGSGTPDIYAKPIIYGVRDSRFFIVAKAMINEKISIDNVVAVYDLSLDGKEKNALKEYEDPHIFELLQIIISRHIDVQNKYRINYS